MQENFISKKKTLTRNYSPEDVATLSGQQQQQQHLGHVGGVCGGIVVLPLTTASPQPHLTPVEGAMSQGPIRAPHPPIIRQVVVEEPPPL